MRRGGQCCERPAGAGAGPGSVGTASEQERGIKVSNYCYPRVERGRIEVRLALTALPKDQRPMGTGIKVREISGVEVQDDSMMETEVCGS